MASKATTLQPIKKGDFTVTPFTVHKEYTVTRDELTNRGYSLKHCVYRRGPLPVSSSNTAFTLAPTSSDGSYDAINWRSLRHLYYREPLEEGYDTFEGYDLNRIEKNLYLTASVISTPYFERGESIKPGSVRLYYNANSYYEDDGNGNLKYTVSRDTVSNNNLITYWSFDDLFEHTKTGYKNNLYINKKPTSNTHIPTYESTYRNVNLKKGADIYLWVGNTHIVDVNIGGGSIEFNGNSLVHTPQYEEINFDFTKDFTVSFHIKCPPSQSNTDSDRNYIISKNGVLRQLHYGIVETYQKNTLVKRRTVSASIDNVDTGIFPYEFSIYNQTSPYNGKVVFRRSDGINTLFLTSSIKVNDNQYHHICVTKSGSNVTFFYDSNYNLSVNNYVTRKDISGEVYNENDLIFGAKNLNNRCQISASIDDVRIYDVAATSLQTYYLGGYYNSPQNALQTNIVGNVFYKQGLIVLTKSHDYAFDKTFLKTYNWKLTYKNTLTIYENEVLCRIKRDELNFTLNPTARQSVRSENLLTEFITGSLTPYITTIGLYTPNLDLVAVGKLSRPLKKRDDVTMNIIVRWDY